MTLTSEAIEEIAAKVRAGEWVSDAHASALREHHAKAVKSGDAGLAVLIAEAWVQPRMRRVQAGYELAWKHEPIVLPQEEPIALEAIENAVAHERNAARRSALWDLACAKANDHFREAKRVVEALRERAEELQCATPDGLIDALGLGAAGVRADALIERSDGLFDELDGWALREVELGERVSDARRRVLPWQERLRSVAQPRASAQIAVGDRVASCGRWIERVGLGDALRAVSDRVTASALVSEGVSVKVEREGERVIVRGSEPPSVRGTARIAGALSEALGAALAKIGRASERAGRDRVHRAALWQLGEMLLWEPSFVTKELAVDGAHASLVNRAALHGSLMALRQRAAEAGFVRDALAAKSELVLRLRDRMVRAMGSAVSPSWTVHIASSAIERRAEAECAGALCAAVLGTRMRERWDEDWFRNPRAGEGLASELMEMRARGTMAWLIERAGAGEAGASEAGAGEAGAGEAGERERAAIERAERVWSARVREAFERATR
ncbi:MAG: hypothetical protein U0269_20310 [Polyangiales bacterium]